MRSTNRCMSKLRASSWLLACFWISSAFSGFFSIFPIFPEFSRILRVFSSHTRSCYAVASALTGGVFGIFQNFPEFLELFRIFHDFTFPRCFLYFYFYFLTVFSTISTCTKNPDGPHVTWTLFGRYLCFCSANCAFTVVFTVLFL